MRFIFAVCTALALLSPPARADDSSASLGAGGLVLRKTDKVALLAEDLFLSTTAVKITYRFHNRTDSDYETVIAFPMPDITGSPDAAPSIPDPKSDNFLKFITRVDGASVESQVEQRAFLKQEGKPDEEITDKLKALNIPLMPTVDATEAAMAALNDGQRKTLADAGIVEQSDFNDDKGRRTVQVPLWTLRSKFWRRQVFPAGKDVVVEQGYVPSVGESSVLSYGKPDMDADQLAYYRKTFCTDEAFAKRARAFYAAAQAQYRKAQGGGASDFRAFEQYLAYVITSGGNWAGPIGEFRLVVDKGDPKTLVSFCGDGVQATGPTTFEMAARNYVPDRDINVLFLRSGSGR